MGSTRASYTNRGIPQKNSSRKCNRDRCSVPSPTALSPPPKRGSFSNPLFLLLQVKERGAVTSRSYTMLYSLQLWTKIRLDSITYSKFQFFFHADLAQSQIMYKFIYNACASMHAAVHTPMSCFTSQPVFLQTVCALDERRTGVGVCLFRAQSFVAYQVRLYLSWSVTDLPCSIQPSLFPLHLPISITFSSLIPFTCMYTQASESCALHLVSINLFEMVHASQPHVVIILHLTSRSGSVTSWPVYQERYLKIDPINRSLSLFICSFVQDPGVPPTGSYTYLWNTMTMSILINIKSSTILSCLNIFLGNMQHLVHVLQNIECIVYCLIYHDIYWGHVAENYTST